MKGDEFKKRITEISENFSLIKKKIGAKDVGFKIVPRELKSPMGKFNSGKPITGVELQKISENWQSKEPFIDEEGNAFVLYISDFTSGYYWSNFTSESLPKYHVCWCWTLENMKESGRMKRYCKKENIETNIFEGRKDGNKIAKAKLYACKNCRTTMEKIYDSSLYFDVDNMDLLKFFSMYEKDKIKYNSVSSRPYSVIYPKHWDKISKKYRKKTNWKCEECERSFEKRKQELHVHHINGVKSDTSASNLKVLCKECHAKQPYHGHMAHISRE